jgi:hypothetical protein
MQRRFHEANDQPSAERPAGSSLVYEGRGKLESARLHRLLRFMYDGLVVHAYKAHQADRIVAEVNNGGDLVEAILRNVDHAFAYKAVHASRGKLTRAEPIAALYEQHRVHHVGTFGVLEDQMCDYGPMASKSPDRMDALVWALTELSGDGEQEVIYEYSEIQSISRDLDDFPDFRAF